MGKRAFPQTCFVAGCLDWATIVRNGRVICDAGVSELISRGTEHLVVRVHDTVTEQAVAVLERHGHTLTRAAGPRGTDELRMPAPRPHPHAPEVLRLLTAQDVYPRELLVESVSLEDIYVAAVRAADAAAKDGSFDRC